MNIQKLIDLLNKIEDKSQEVVITVNAQDAPLYIVEEDLGCIYLSDEG